MSGLGSEPTRPQVLARLEAPRSSTRTRVGVIADPHLSTRAYGTWKVYHRTDQWLSRAVEILDARDVDVALIAGDLTKDGEWWNFDRFDEHVGDLEAPIEVIPGNHDVPKVFDDHDVPSIEAFEDRYTPDGLPFATGIDDVTLIGLNSATMPDGSLAHTWGGAVSREQLRWLEGVLEETSTPIVAVHHNLFDLPEHDGSPWDNFPLRNAGELFDVLADHGVSLVVSGHHHVPAATRNDGVCEVILPAVCSFPHAVATIDVDERGTTVTMHPVATPAELIEGYEFATEGKEMGREIAAFARTRLEQFPLLEE